MSNFPGNYDDDVTLPFVNDNITEIGGEATNALRDAVLAIEQNIGLGAAGTTSSIANRLSVSFFPDGYLKPSVIASLGLVTLPITGDQIAAWAEVPESKLKLDHRTQDLFNYIRDLSGDINLAIGWISTEGVKIAPHVLGALYQHSLEHILVSSGSAFLSNKFRSFRNNLNASTAINELNDELLAHQWADGSPFGDIKNVTTNNGSVFPSNYAHFAGGIYLNTSRFTVIPQTAYDVQLFAEFIDSTSIFLLGTRIQNLYTSGISRVSRSQTLDLDGYGQHLVPTTPVITYLKNIGNNSSPFDDIDTGDDIVEFKPSTADMDSNFFDSKFALIKVGDIIRVNYGSVEIPFIIKEKKYIQSGGNKKYVVRIVGKNIAYVDETVASARIDKPLINNNKYGILSLSAVNNVFNELPSLIVNSPRGGEALGVGFNPNQLDENHYLLHLVLYPTGNPDDGYTFLPGIDVTGNLGKTPGLYTLESVVEATNNSFRASGYNYRFAAFSYQGEFGIMLADPYNNAAFSVISGVVDENGFYDETASNLNFSSNVVDVFSTYAGGGIDPFSYGDLSGLVGIDPLGFGPTKGNIASPPYMNSYGSAEAAQNPTKLYIPLNKKNYYVNGAERDRLNLEVGQALDPLGDGYWVGTIVAKSTFPSPGGRVQVTYRIPLDLSTSSLKAGKTVVVQSLGPGSLIDFGRFIIQDVSFGCDPVNYTDITLYDVVHGTGSSPPITDITLGIAGYAAIYFNSNSVSFNAETATDFSEVSPFKRHFEVYTDSSGHNFTHERGRIYIGGPSVLVNSTITLYSSTELAKLDIVKISPKLRGYQLGSVNKITLHIDNYSSTTGVFSGYLALYDGVDYKKQGPTVYGKKGEVTRFYDETHIDYIDIIFDVNIAVSSFSNENIDFQLFPTLSLDDEIMLIGTCQLNDTLFKVTQVRDERQFGNISEKDVSTSLLNFMATPERLLHFNGVIRGFDVIYVEDEKVALRGGIALVNGKFQYPSESVVVIPTVKEDYSPSYYPINWALCINSVGELVTIPLTDYDATLGTPNDPTRLMSVFNTVSSTTYNLDCISFANLINNRKDLTILYIVSSTVSGSGSGTTVSLSYKDVRRYVNDQDSSIPATITTADAQGNFRDINSAITWLRFNNPLQNTLIIKGNQTVLSGITYHTGQFNIYPQGSGSTLTFAGAVAVTNFRFTDLPVTINGAANLTSTHILNVPLTVTGSLTATSLYADKNSIISVSGNVNAQNSEFTGGSFTSTGGGTFTNCNLDNNYFFSLSGGTNVFDNCTLNDITSNILISGNTTLTRTHVKHITDLTFNNNLTVDESQIDDMRYLTVNGACTIASFSKISNIEVLTVGGQWTNFPNQPGNVQDLTIINTPVNNVYGTTSGDLTINSSSCYDSSLSGASFTTDSSQFTNFNAFSTGTFDAINCEFTNSVFTDITNATFTNCKFINCSFTISGTLDILGDSNYFENTTVSVGGVSTITNAKFISCNLTFTGGGTFTNVYIDPSQITIGASITASVVTILESTLNVSTARAFEVTAGNFRFEKNSVTWTGTASGGSYTSSDIVNSSNGLIYAAATSSAVNNVVVNDNTFTYSISERFPFVSIQLTQFSAVAQNISVCRNKFSSTSGTEDFRAVVAIISTLEDRAANGTFPQYPALNNVHIDENFCNHNQLIIISGTRKPVIGAMVGANPLVINTTISKNTCGTIGYFVASAGSFDGNNVGSPNLGIVRDKSSKLIIDGNYCKYISTLDQRGDYVAFRATRYPSANYFEEVGSTMGNVLISNNTCNWIHAGIGGYTIGPSTTEIINNNLCPSDSSFLNNYSSSVSYGAVQSITPSNVGIIIRRPHNATDTSAASVISGNSLTQEYSSTGNPGITISSTTGAGVTIVVTTTTSHGFTDGQLVTVSGVAGNTAANGTWYISSASGNVFTLVGSLGNGSYSSGGIVVATNVYYYDAGIACFNNSRIESNRISGVINNIESPLLYFWNVLKSVMISNNILERRGLEVKAYIWLDRFDGGKNTNDGFLIIGNLFDAVVFAAAPGTSIYGGYSRAILSYITYNNDYEVGVKFSGNLFQQTSSIWTVS